jgi:diguanylate cyclase (GGDEF)-like protein
MNSDGMSPDRENLFEGGLTVGTLASVLEVIQGRSRAERGPVRVSRQELAIERPMWVSHGLMYLLISIATGVLAFALPSVSPGPMLAYAALVGLAGLIMLATRPPAIGTVENHVALISVYGFIGLGEVVYASDWEVPLAAAMFIGTLIGLRLIDRRQIAGHLCVATLCMVLPAVIATSSAAALFGVGAVVCSVWVLAGVVVLQLSRAEDQGRQLEDLLRRDPLTGVGNELLLAERLSSEMQRHAKLRRPLSVLAVDLTEFSDLNEQFGRAIGDDLLAQAAASIRAVLPEGATLSRPADDEFWILLPGTDLVASHDAVAEIRWALSGVGIAGADRGLAAAVGVASYPVDAVDDAVLSDLARERMVADRDRGHYPAPALPDGTAALPPAAPLPVQPSTRGITRAAFAHHRSVWLVTAAVYSFVGLGVLASLPPAGHDGRLVSRLLLLVCITVAAALVLPRGAIRRHGIWDHAILTSAYGSVAVGFWALQPEPGIALAIAMFMPPLVAVRLSNRTAVVVHLSVMTVMFTGLIAAGGASDALTESTMLELALLIPSTWSLGISAMIALELAEAQGRDLEQLVRTDPVTGAGNRLMLGERLGEEIDRHAALPTPLSILLVEVLETFENSRRESEELLRAAADTITAALGPDDTVIRRRGHEFVLILPEADEAAVAHSVAAVRAGMADLSRRGHRVECIQASASYAVDGVTVEDLLEAADARLLIARSPEGFSHSFDRP